MERLGLNKYNIPVNLDGTKALHGNYIDHYTSKYYKNTVYKARIISNDSYIIFGIGLVITYKKK
jgi:hypothetical protein